MRTALAAAILLVLVGCRRSGLPEPGSNQYRDLVHAFYVGLAGLQSGEDVRARAELTRATQIAPGEPASWADLGLLSIRQQELDAAFQAMDKARSLAPDNSRIEFYIGDIESRRGNLAEAIRHFKRAVDLDPRNLKALYSLAAETERQGAGSSDAEALSLLRKVLEQQPANTAVLLEVARLSSKLNNSTVLKSTVAKLTGESSAWPDEARQQMDSLRQTALGPNPRSAALQVAFLRNVLLRVPRYRQDSEAVKTPAVFAGEPFVKFLKLPSPSSEPAAPDLKLAFESRPIAGASPGPAYWIRSVFLDDSGKASLIWADASGVHLPGGDMLPFPGPTKFVAAADLNYDFKTDLLIAGPGGVRIYQQQDPSHFTDITPHTGLPKDIVNGSYTGAWAFDVDLDGDLDIVLGVAAGPPVVLRNNADGTYATVRPFSENVGLASFASADIDGDGDPDVAMVDRAGHLTVFMNERLGQYRARPVPREVAEGVEAVTAGDVNSDGFPDFVILKQDGAVVRLSDKDGGAAWDTAELVKAAPSPNANLTLADFDNNGALDLLVGDGQIFLGGAQGFTRLAASPAIVAPSAVDLDNDGKLDLVGISPSGVPVSLINHGALNYHWQQIRTRAANAHGDQRINSFGLGGEIEIRAGLLTEKQIITSPVLHFGLGDHTGTDLARITWPNGFIQVEFDLKPDQSILAPQRLKGSCPFLFTWNGKRMIFPKDGEPWSPALGLHINAQTVAGIYQTREWFKVGGDQLVPHDGYYDLRVTAELWEVYYIDYYSLLVVDHPKGTEIYSDERFADPPPALKVYTTAPPRPFAKATDDNGHDVSAIVGSLDQNYLDTFGRGQYQGVTRDHWVELELPDDAPRTGPLYLIADGWMHPTDGTTNIALGQTCNPPPRGLRIEVQDANGRWVVAKSGLGFPAGRLKTTVLDLTGIFRPNAPRKLRLGTNLEIYWDKLAWAPGLSNDRNRTRELSLSSAELRYRGFSQIDQANPSSPEIPNYNLLVGTAQKWRDLEGYSTRFGDVKELLDKVDDRIVITAAGDELRLRFQEHPPPPDGFVRDFIMVGDGWIKDGDYNSTFSKTVLPLPYHGIKDYTLPPGRLEDDPAYKLHPDDWKKFHTRYITPDHFRQALWNRAVPQ